MSEIAEEDLEESEITSVAGQGYKFGKSSVHTASIVENCEENKANEIERVSSVGIHELGLKANDVAAQQENKEKDESIAKMEVKLKEFCDTVKYCLMLCNDNQDEEVTHKYRQQAQYFIEQAEVIKLIIQNLKEDKLF